MPKILSLTHTASGRPIGTYASIAALLNSFKLSGKVPDERMEEWATYEKRFDVVEDLGYEISSIETDGTYGIAEEVVVIVPPPSAGKIEAYAKLESFLNTRERVTQSGDKWVLSRGYDNDETFDSAESLMTEGLGHLGWLWSVWGPSLKYPGGLGLTIGHTICVGRLEGHVVGVWSSLLDLVRDEVLGLTMGKVSIKGNLLSMLPANGADGPATVYGSASELFDLRYRPAGWTYQMVPLKP